MVSSFSCSSLAVAPLDHKWNDPEKSSGVPKYRLPLIERFLYTGDRVWFAQTNLRQIDTLSGFAGENGKSRAGQQISNTV